MSGNGTTMQWMWALCLLGSVAGVRAQEVSDVALYTPFRWESRDFAPLYFNGRAVGADPAARQAIVDQIAKLPLGTSFVWGPFYNRCGACSGEEPANVLAKVDPALWQKLDATMKARGVVSKAYPGPFPRATLYRPKPGLPKAITPDQLPGGSVFDVRLNWELGRLYGEKDVRKREDFGERRSFRFFTTSDQELDEYGYHTLLGRIREQGRVLIVMSVDPKLDLADEDNSLSVLAGDAAQKWDDDFADAVRLGKLQVALVAQPKLVPALHALPQTLEINWTNFHGPKTPPSSVLYFVGGEYVGRGDAGLDQVIARMRKLPSGSLVSYPEYALIGRRVHETLSEDEIERQNKELENLVPFPGRQMEFLAVIKKGKLEAIESDAGFIREANRVSIRDWESGDDFGAAFASFGRIVRHNEKRSPAVAALGWSRWDTRKPESTAVYTLNGEETGVGDVGFEAAMNRLTKLPAGSVVQVRVNIRTQPPFTCPIVFQDAPHFERTGFEPYCGMYPWLIDVAAKHTLKIEWIPDEAKSAQQCEIAK